VIRLPGMPQVARGAQVKLDILRWDEVDLTVEARLLEVHEQAASAEADFEEEEEEQEEEEAAADAGEAAAAEAVEAEGAVAVVTTDEVQPAQ
jgi:exoribonuclease-2